MFAGAVHTLDSCMQAELPFCARTLTRSYTQGICSTARVSCSINVYRTTCKTDGACDTERHGIYGEVNCACVCVCVCVFVCVRQIYSGSVLYVWDILAAGGIGGITVSRSCHMFGGNVSG